MPKISSRRLSAAVSEPVERNATLLDGGGGQGPDGDEGGGAQGGARGADEPLSGNKAWLRRRLHAAIVRAHLEGAAAEGV